MDRRCLMLEPSICTKDDLSMFLSVLTFTTVSLLLCLCYYNCTSHRNVMMRLNLQLTMGTFSLSLFGLIGVAFGMNLMSSFEEVYTVNLVAYRFLCLECQPYETG